MSHMNFSYTVGNIYYCNSKIKSANPSKMLIHSLMLTRMNILKLLVPQLGNNFNSLFLTQKC